MKNLFILSLIFIFQINITNAQPKVVVFNSPTEEAEKNQMSEKNMIKFSVLEALAGDFSFSYERVLHEKLSAEVSLGVTISDYITSLYNNEIDVFDNSFEAALGNSFALGLRYYPISAPEYFYVAPEFKYKKYNNFRTFDDFNKGEESRSLAIGRITFGYNYLLEHNIFLDFHGGFGIAKITQNKYDVIGNTVDPTTGFTAYNYGNVESSKLAPRIHLGLKIGIAF